ncbi:MAG: TolC family protein [Bacteroidales bacterium]|nr:TolC family protein [Bacteroidales bacterium]
MIRNKKIIIIIVLIGFSIKIFGQDTLLITFDDAVRIALKESYTIKLFKSNQQSMQHYFSFYKATFKPRLDLNLFAPAWSESVNEIQQADTLPVYNSNGSMKIGGDLKFTYTLPTGGNLAFTSYSYREYISTAFSGMNYKRLNTNDVYNRFVISLEQPLFTKNRLKEDLKEAELQYEKSNCTYTRAQMDIIYNVSLGFYNLYRASMEKDIANEKMKNSEESFRIAKLKYETGNIPEGDLLIAEITKAQNKTKYSEVCSLLEREKDNFKQLIGLDMDKNIVIVTDLRYDIYKIDLDTAINQGLLNRLELSEAQFDIELQKIQTDRAKREGRMQGKISAYYDLTGVSTSNKGSLSELYNSSIDNIKVRPPNRSVVFSIAIPISDWGRSKSLYRRENCKLEEKKLILENTKNTIIKEIRDIVRTVEESRSRLSIYEKNKEVSTKSYKISQLRFSNGELTSQQLAVEQERLSQVQLEYLNAYITYQMALADLKRKTMWDFQNYRSYTAPLE